MFIVVKPVSGNLSKMYENYPIDFSIKFGDIEYPCHKFAVSISSSFVFNETKKNIELSSLSFRKYSFKSTNKIMKYLYGSDLVINLDNVQEFHQLAIDLEISRLIEDCILLKQGSQTINRYCSSNISPQRATIIAKSFHLFKSNKEFLSLSPSNMKIILQQPAISIESEYELVMFLNSYMEFNRWSDPEVFRFVRSELFTEREAKIIWDELRIRPRELIVLAKRRLLWSDDDEANQKNGLLKLGIRICPFNSMREQLCELLENDNI